LELKTRRLPIREEGVLRIFIAFKNPSSWPGFEPAIFGSSGQHTNHNTTKATQNKLLNNNSQARKLIWTRTFFCQMEGL
jgi:hypothetical protein